MVLGRCSCSRSKDLISPESFSLRRVSMQVGGKYMTHNQIFLKAIETTQNTFFR